MKIVSPIYRLCFHALGSLLLINFSILPLTSPPSTPRPFLTTADFLWFFPRIARVLHFTFQFFHQLKNILGVKLNLPFLGRVVLSQYNFDIKQKQTNKQPQCCSFVEKAQVNRNSSFLKLGGGESGKVLSQNTNVHVNFCHTYDIKHFGCSHLVPLQPLIISHFRTPPALFTVLLSSTLTLNGPPSCLTLCKDMM